MAEIKPPPGYYKAPPKNVIDYLRLISDWHSEFKITEEGSLGGVWFRGHDERYSNPLRPGVYREDFEKRAAKLNVKGNLEHKRLEVERRMLDEFRCLGAAFIRGNGITEQYFIAQHYGMPTRLLDWTTNPLAGLFFAVENIGKHNKTDGEVFVMDAKGILPKDSGLNYHIWGVVSMRHPYASDAIRPSFWLDPQDNKRTALVIPVRPDNQLPRIAQQSSCFTLHMHNSSDATNDSLAKILIPKDAKGDMLNELHKMNITQFTIYNDLDHISKDIRRVWEVR